MDVGRLRNDLSGSFMDVKEFQFYLSSSGCTIRRKALKEELKEFDGASATVVSRSRSEPPKKKK